MISVIIPLYNKERSIKRTIQSVLSQQYNDYELIVVDDGSTDKGKEIVKSINNGRILLIEQDNSGPGAARNTGINVSKGEWVLFLDADDELLNDALFTYAKLAHKYPEADVIDCGQLLKEKDRIHKMPHSLEGWSQNPFRDWFYNKICPGSNHSLFRKTILLANPYNPNLRRFEDAELLVRILESAKIYSTLEPTSLVHCEYASASKRCNSIYNDYISCLSMKGKSFWARMCVYRIYLENRELYLEDIHRLYPFWRYRYDLLLIYKLIKLLRV